MTDLGWKPAFPRLAPQSKKSDSAHTSSNSDASTEEKNTPGDFSGGEGRYAAPWYVYHGDTDAAGCGNEEAGGGVGKI